MTEVAKICKEYGLGQTQLARRFGIPLRTVQNWHSGIRPAPEYVVRMMRKILENEKNK